MSTLGTNPSEVSTPEPPITDAGMSTPRINPSGVSIPEPPKAGAGISTPRTNPSEAGTSGIPPVSSGHASTQPSTLWIWKRVLIDTRSTTLLFLFLFLLAMPIALLVIGKEGYLLLSKNLAQAWPNYPFLDGISTVFFAIHILIALLSAAASLVLVNLNFRFLYKMPSTDVAFSAPLTRTQHFVGRLAATLTSLFVIYLGNAIATAGILFAWKEHAIIWQYLPLYAITLLSSCVLAAFSAVVHSLSGRLFDANVFNLFFQAAWAISLAIMLQPLNIGRPYFRKQLIFVMAPVADIIYVAFARHSVWVRLILSLLFWTFIGILVMRRRPAERAEVKIGRFKWHSAVQPLFSLFIGLLLGNFLEMLFVTNNYSLRKHAALFYIGLFVGAFLGQLASSSISGKTLRRASRRTPKVPSAPPAPAAIPRSDTDILPDNKAPATDTGVSAQSASFNCDTFRAAMPETLPATDGKTPNPQADTPASTKDEKTEVSRPEDFSYPRSKTADVLRPNVHPPTSARPNNGTGRLRLPWLLQEWIHSLAGVALYFLVDAISRGGYLF